MTALLSRKQVEELAVQNPIDAIARCREVISRQNMRDTKREAWSRLIAKIEAGLAKANPLPAPVIAIAKVPEKAKAKAQSKAKPSKAEKGCWQVEGTEGSRIVPYITKAVPGLFGGKPVSLSDETWRYLSSHGNAGKRYYLTDPADALYAYYTENGIIPNIESVRGCGHRGLIAIALDPQEGE